MSYAEDHASGARPIFHNTLDFDSFTLQAQIGHTNETKLVTTSRRVHEILKTKNK